MNMFSDNTTTCVTYDHLVTRGTDSSPYNTEEAASMPPNAATASLIPRPFPAFQCCTLKSGRQH